MMQFTKMNGAGNDFVMVDNRQSGLALSKEQIARICDRHRGVGADGLIAVEPSEAGADFRMRYYNADGGEAEMCGNGARCFTRFACRVSGKTGRISFETMAGILGAELQGDEVVLAMTDPKDFSSNITLDVEGTALVAHCMNTGVPHAVVPVGNLQSVDVAKTGAAIRWHTHFAPRGTNANFLQRLENGSYGVRTYERGVEGETLACGTGVVACALVANRIDDAVSPVAVQVKGGETMRVHFTRNAEGTYSSVTLTGPAEFVFEGQIAVE